MLHRRQGCDVPACFMPTFSSTLVEAFRRGGYVPIRHSPVLLWQTHLHPKSQRSEIKFQRKLNEPRIVARGCDPAKIAGIDYVSGIRIDRAAR